MTHRPVFFDWGRMFAAYIMCGVIWWELGMNPYRIFTWLPMLALAHIGLTVWSARRYERDMHAHYKKVETDWTAKQKKGKKYDGRT